MVARQDNALGQFPNLRCQSRPTLAETGAGARDLARAGAATYLRERGNYLQFAEIRTVFVSCESIAGG